MLSKRIGTVLTVLLLVLSAVGGVATAATGGGLDDGAVTSHDSDGNDLNGTASNADEAYVTTDGDVVLVYNYDDADSSKQGHAGVNVSAGLAHVLMTSEDVETDVTGDATMWVTPDGVTANGTLSTPRPDALTDLQFAASSVQNDTHRDASMSLNATAELPSGSEGMALSLLQKAETSGFVRTDATSLVSNGSAGVELPVSVGADRTHRFVLTEQDGQYTFSVEESHVLEGSTADWQTREDAKRTLNQEYCEGDTEVDCSVSLDRYALSDGDRLDLAYTVTFEGVDAALSEAIVTGLTTPGSNTTEAQATELADHVENVTLSRIEGELVVAGGDASVSWNVSMDGTDDLTLAYAGVLDAVERAATANRMTPGGPEMATFGGPFSTPGDLADRLRAHVAASRNADIERTSRWDATLTSDDGTVEIAGTFTAETTNWADYVDELEARDVNVADSTRMSLQARTVEDRIDLDAAYRVRDDGLYDRTVAKFNRTLTQYADDPDGVAETMSTVEAAGFDRARMDLTLTDESLTAESAVAVENASVLSDELPAPLSDIDGSYTDFAERQTVVRLDGALDGDATESDVRALAFVGEETDVETGVDPGDLDLGSLDADYVRDYLWPAESSGDDGLPMVGLAAGGVALTAAAGGGLILTRLG